MTVSQLNELLNAWAPYPLAEDFDNVGLLVGDHSTEVKGVLVAHDALETVITEAIQKKCNVVVCFHPIIFSGIKRLTGASYVERAVLKAIKNDIAIIAVHTALDNVSHGVSQSMCDALHLENTRVLMPKAATLEKLITYAPHDAQPAISEALFAAGAGNIGNYSECQFTVEGQGTFKPEVGSNPTLGSQGKRHTESERQIHITYDSHKRRQIVQALKKAHPYETVAYEIIALENKNADIGMGKVGTLSKPMKEGDFLEMVKSTFQTGGIRYSAKREKPIQKVAVLGGSGAFGIKAAKASRADAYITADLKYHDYYQAENRILLLDVGHYESERFTKKIIADYLTEKNCNFAIILSEENTNPINYF